MAIRNRKSYSVTKRRLAAVFLLLLGLALGIYDAAAIWNDRVPENLKLRGALAVSYRLGLDFQGGTHLVYQADFSIVSIDDPGSAMQGLRDIIARRAMRLLRRKFWQRKLKVKLAIRALTFCPPNLQAVT